MTDTRPIHVRDVPACLWKRVKVRAAWRDITLREAVLEALRLWLETDKENH